MSSKLTFASIIALTSLVFLLRQTPYFQAPNSHQTLITYPSNQQIVENICASASGGDYYNNIEQETSQRVLEFLNSFQDGNPLEEFALGEINNKDFNQFIEDYGYGLIPYASVGVVMLFLTFLSCCFYCCNCRCCKSCMGRPSSQKRRVYAFFGFFLLIAMSALSLTAFIFALNYLDDFEDAACSGATLIGTVTYGNPSQQWIGLDPAIQTLTTINENITETINNLPDIGTTTTELEENYNATSAEILALYNNYSTSTVGDPKNNQSTIIPEFITNLGPPTADDTVTYYLQYELDQKFDVTVSTLQEVNSSLASLKSQVGSVQQNIAEGISQAQSFSGSVSEILYTYSNTTEQIQKYQSYFSTTLIVYFAFFTILSVLLCVSFFLTIFIGKECLPKLTSGGYKILLSNICILFFFGSFGFPILMFSQNACGVANDAFNNKTVFDGILTNYLNDPNIQENVGICLFGNGDILSQFGIQQYLQEFSSIGNGIDQINSTFNSSTPPSVVIPIQVNYINQFKAGYLPVNQTIVEELVSLQKTTNYAVSGSPQACDATQDTWVLNSANCTSEMGTVFPSNAPANFEIPRPTCLGLNNFQMNPYLRYTPELFSGCGPTNGLAYNQYAANYVVGFQNHMKDVNNLFDLILDNLTTLNGMDQDFLDECMSLTAPIIEVNTSFGYILNAISNNQTGLYPNFNCGFIKANGNNLIENLCGNYLSNFFVTFILSMVLGIVTWIAVLPMFCLTRILKENKPAEVRQILIENAYDPLSYDDFETKRKK